ncbi:uncharacterized protein L969DRAFT_96811 [Mixia osmundae IAM 14324]|uniref:Importin N-terminal domain-containing protein n=1 Tax=Mixia osmundae (strain CBS 9802 / IAM 14324 / JCM 22182 / KY 12970) TaxID=764103 RepID=G7E258_MIXOS|nr:uncharacterized protein L969DRAFT_96811 [Mixia osmundae IAM 14324]KEI36790.1 hypothetical protein L969DRAFT_96811 [Mixia osmundae IAM 14324]GAA96918.1 hypothetical protein E5Q_03592 [Mixia osmundae IAM 14324]
MTDQGQLIYVASQLQASFGADAQARRAAERALQDLQSQPGYGQLLLTLAQSDRLDGAAPSSSSGVQLDRSVRQGATLLFKNWVKLNWDREDAPYSISAADRAEIKTQIVAVMISLSALPALQIQLGEAISLIAESDFPEHWSELFDSLIAALSPDDYVLNNGVLQTVHSICKRWRAQFRSDGLFLEIKYVLERFCPPYLHLFQQVDTLLSSPEALPAPRDPMTLSRTLLLLLQIFYDLNSQDLPEYFEDHQTAFMTLLVKYLDWDRPELHLNEDEDEAGPLEKIRSSICEIVELYTLRYLDVFEHMEQFVGTTWNLLTTIGQSQKYDVLVSKATRFLSVAVRMPSKRALFESPDTLQSMCERIILPSMTLREFEEEMFEEDPPEYVRRDLESNAESDTRRQAATEFTRALMEQFSEQVTAIITRYIAAYLQQYKEDPAGQWRSKDTAIYLLTSIASTTSTMQHGVTSTNSLVNVSSFFSDHILPDLQASANVHPIILADAIKFVYAFRSQLTREQLLSVISPLGHHLGAQSYVLHTYSAVTIERILFVRVRGRSVITQQDLQPSANTLLITAFSVIERGNSPEMLASNESLMKCVMRTILTTREGLAPNVSILLQHLTNIIVEISKNPSNPRFNHYTFESVAALVRFMVAAQPDLLSSFEGALFPPFEYILAQDVNEFTPFVFQILSQLLELHTDDLPATYLSLLDPLLAGTLWTQRGNVPALARLLRAFLARGASDVVSNGKLPAIRDIIRYLINGKANDAYTCDLVEALFETVPTPALEPYLRDLLILMLTRLTSSKTPTFVQAFIRTILFPIAVGKPGLSADELIAQIEAIQPGLFVQMLQAILPDAQKAPMKNRKIIEVGLSGLLSTSQRLQTPPMSNAWPGTLTTLLKLFLQHADLTSTGQEAEDDIVIADLEEFGYQASFSRLGAADIKRVDPVASIIDTRAHFAQALAGASRATPGKLPPMIAAVAQDLRGPFEAYLLQQDLRILIIGASSLMQRRRILAPKRCSGPQARYETLSLSTVRYASLEPLAASSLRSVLVMLEHLGASQLPAMLIKRDAASTRQPAAGKMPTKESFTLTRDDMLNDMAKLSSSSAVAKSFDSLSDRPLHQQPQTASITSTEEARELLERYQAMPARATPEQSMALAAHFVRSGRDLLDKATLNEQLGVKIESTMRNIHDLRSGLGA